MDNPRTDFRPNPEWVHTNDDSTIYTHQLLSTVGSELRPGNEGWSYGVVHEGPECGLCKGATIYYFSEHNSGRMMILIECVNAHAAMITKLPEGIRLG